MRYTTTPIIHANFSCLFKPNPLFHQNWKWACMERALDVRDVFERTFSDEDDLARWQVFRAFWNPSGAFVQSKCPSSDVLMLQREDGRGDRSIQDYGAIGRVMRELGVCSYRNVSIGSSTSLGDQAKLFENYGLLLSVHSSQLRNVIWSHPLSATLEIRQTFEQYRKNMEWKRLLSPFCTAGMCPTIYSTTAGHGKHGLTGPVELDIPRFKSALRELLLKQKKALEKAGCPLLPHNTAKCEV